MTASTGGTDVVDILTSDHREVLDLLGQISSASADQQKDMADTVIAEIVRHSVAEEMYVYPAMRKHLPDGEEQVQHDIEEHQELLEAMKRWEKQEPSDADFLSGRDEVEQLLRHHASDEETDQFPVLREKIPHDDLVELGTKVEIAKKAAPTRPHPTSSHSELFHKTLGPGVGLVDRMRDALMGKPNSAE
jgi:hemerythrin-like domain-containing protein